MTNARQAHVGKSPTEKFYYNEFLKKQQAEDPTYEKKETSPTDSVIVDEDEKSSLTEPTLKPYAKSKVIQWKEILTGVIVFVVTTILFLLVISLNRDVGVLEEKAKNVEKEQEKNNTVVEKINSEIMNIKIELGIRKNSR